MVVVFSLGSCPCLILLPVLFVLPVHVFVISSSSHYLSLSCQTSAGDDDTSAASKGTKGGDDTRDAVPVAENPEVASPVKPNLSGVKAAAARRAAGES